MTESLINVTSLYEESRKERLAKVQEIEREMVTRWMTILTKQHIEEKIKEAHTSRVEQALLVDEHYDESIYELINTSKLFYKAHAPYTVSVKEHIQSLFDMGSVLVEHREKVGRVLITVYWGDGKLQALANEIPDCMPLIFSLCLCALCCMSCGH